MTTTTQPPRRHAQAHTPLTATTPIAPTTILLFTLGVILLICCALAITHLDKWAEEHGQILVFVAFFIIMSLAGRWFWGGIDAALTRIRSR